MRFLLFLSCLVTGLVPLGLGAYLANRGDYYVSACCFVVAVCSFQQLYYFLTHNEISDALLIQIAEQQQEIDAQKESHALEKKQITHNLGEIFSAKVEEQNQRLEAGRKRLAEVNRMLEQRNKEIWSLKNDY